jgi:hypothetical protein
MTARIQNLLSWFLFWILLLESGSGSAQTSSSSSSQVSKGLSSGTVLDVKAATIRLSNLSVPLRLAANTFFTIQVSVGQNQLLTVVVDSSASLSVFKASSVNLLDRTIQVGGGSATSSVSSGLGQGVSIFYGSTYTSTVSISGDSAGTASASSSDCPFVVSSDPSLPYDGPFQ